MNLSKGGMDLLNHLLKFDYYQVLLTNDKQQISYAARKDNPSQKVVINQIKKEALIQSFEVSSVIRSFKHLVMLEEDTNHWYFITEQLSGLPIDQASANFEQMTGGLPSHEVKQHLHTFLSNHLGQLTQLYRHYLILGPYYTAHLLKPENLRFQEEGLETIELLVLDENTSSETLDAEVSLHFIETVKQLFLALSLELPTELATRLKPEAVILTNLSAVDDWLLQPTASEIPIATLEAEPKAEMLEGLYIKSPEEVSAITLRRQADLERKKAELEAASITQTHAPLRKNWQLPALMLLFALAFVLSLPYLRGMFDKPEVAKETPVTTQPAKTSETLPVTEKESQIDLEHINLSGNKWQIDQQFSHSGADSIRLDEVSSQPSNVMSIKDIRLSQNANLSFWLMTKPSGKVVMDISLYSGNQLVNSSKQVFSSEAEMIWYMVNPLTDLTLNNETVDRIDIVFGGDVDTLWVDDIQVDSYK